MKTQFARVAALNTSPKAVCTAFLLCFAIPAVLYTTHSLSLLNLEERSRQSANAISQDIGERIGVISTVLASLAGLHQVSATLDNDILLRFADDILDNASYIRNLGSFDIVPNAHRDAFESKMSLNGDSDFSIAEINYKGTFSARTTHEFYYPISIAGPLNSVVPALLGTDLGTLPEFKNAFEMISNSNTVTIIPLPEQWPLKGDIIALLPVFNSSAKNELSAPKLDRQAGGFWLTIDVQSILTEIHDVIKEFDVSIELISADTRTPIHSETSKNQQNLFFSQWYDKARTQEIWSVSPSTRLVITLEQERGLTLMAIVFGGLVTFLITLISCTFTAHMLSQRQLEIERRESLQNLAKEREKAEKTLNSVQDAIITFDPELNIIHVNPAAVIQFNTRASLVVGKPLNTIAKFNWANENKDAFDINAEIATLSHNSKTDFDVIPTGRCEEDFIYRMSLSSSRDHDNNITGHVMVLRDISHERRLTRKLDYQANFDALTGCTNRYFFEQVLDQLIDDLPTSEQTHTLCYMDLDQFKIINDTCGHRAGDQLLIELTQSLQLMIRDEDVLSRLGGDEFGLIMVDVCKDRATAVAERIYEFFQNFNFTHQGNSFSVTASIGVVHIDHHCANTKDIMASADIACYAAKDSGRNSMSVYSKSDEGMAERSEELNWLPRLQTALTNDEFRLHIQAIAALSPALDKPDITHYEFLLRLADSDGTEVTPWQFIQAAERYDLMRDIDRWVIKNALKAVAKYADVAGSDCSFSINLSGQSAADPALKSFIQNQIQINDVDPTKIWFELTETAAISHLSVAVDLIQNIRSTGAKVALDDFGSGLSSFGYLKNLPVDIIKIDGQFVKEIVNNPIDREMVRAIHRVGQSMNIETVAEFVENQETVDELIRLGVNYAQGYHIGKPLPIADAMAAHRKKKAA